MSLGLSPTEIAIAQLRLSAGNLREQARTLDKQAGELEATLPKPKKRQKKVDFMKFHSRNHKQ